MFRSYKTTRKQAIGLVDADGALVIRLAGRADAGALWRLAALDSSLPLAAPVLVADAGGELRAARSLTDGRTIADPFRWTAAFVALLELRARQLAVPDATALRPTPSRTASQRPRAA